MILFDLRCSNGHAFEGWFRDNATYEMQAEAGAIACSICGQNGVTKALMAPALATRGGVAPEGDDPSPESESAPSQPKTGRQSGPKLDAKQLGKTMRALRQMQAHIEKNFEHVGPRFAEEARKMHDGEGKKRSIYGEASAAEASELRDDGIEIGQVPWLRRPDA